MNLCIIYFKRRLCTQSTQQPRTYTARQSRRRIISYQKLLPPLLPILDVSYTLVSNSRLLVSQLIPVNQLYHPTPTPAMQQQQPSQSRTYTLLGLRHSTCSIRRALFYPPGPPFHYTEKVTWLYMVLELLARLQPTNTYMYAGIHMKSAFHCFG